MAVYKQISTGEDKPVLVRADLSQGELEALIQARLTAKGLKTSPCIKETLAVVNKPATSNTTQTVKKEQQHVS